MFYFDSDDCDDFFPPILGAYCSLMTKRTRVCLMYMCLFAGFHLDCFEAVMMFYFDSDDCDDFFPPHIAYLHTVLS
jgi:hypothetical protein